MNEFKPFCTGPASATPKALPSYNEAPSKDYLRLRKQCMITYYHTLNPSLGPGSRGNRRGDNAVASK